MADFVEQFHEPLRELETARLKIDRDRAGFVFLGLLLNFLAFVCALTWLFSRGSVVGALALLFFVSGFFARSFSRQSDERYQALFREKVTRVWFRQRFSGVFLASPPKEISPQLGFLLRGLRLKGLGRARIEDRIHFDRETEDSYIFVVAKGSRRYLTFMRTRNGTAAPVSSSFVTALERFGKVDSRATTDGVWASMRLHRRLFDPPLKRPVTDAEAYSDWDDDAKILLDPDLRLAWIAAR